MLLRELTDKDALDSLPVLNLVDEVCARSHEVHQRKSSD